MAKLLRIITINGHLPGVVELDLDGHTNICGSNASGKTTLQRMIPVFYGERPNRVVPRTRLNFDKYYLPYKNSYVVYEYERPAHGRAQVVLTKRVDGIDYRFVDCAYQAEHYLYDKGSGVVAREYSDWAQAMRGRGMDMTAKISSTTEYRNIILNDIKNDRSSRSESLKYRQLAARYGLASENFRLRHIEKLVSAVHAKEGKMDTLKSMLAAILEEDGYKRPDNTFTGDKIRAWLRDMKQFLKVESLQKSLTDIERISADRTRTLEQLWHLKAVIEHDFKEQKRKKADTEAAIRALKRGINDAQNSYEIKRGELRERRNDARSDLKKLEEQLSDAQRQYDDYRNNDMEQLGRELEALPECRRELEGLEQHHATMMDAHNEAEQKLHAHKLKIKEKLEQVSTTLRLRIEEKSAQQTALMQQELDETKQLNRHLQDQQQTVLEQFETQLEQQQNELATKRAQRELSTLTDDERNDIRVAEARVDQAQEQLNDHQQIVNQQQEQLNTAFRARERLDNQIKEARAHVAQTEQRIEKLQQRLQPEAGSLRQFLVQNVEQWEQSFGRVIAEPLLQRTDLTPRVVADKNASSLYGIELDLHAIELPEHAVSEERLREQLELATEQWQRQQEQLKKAEKIFAEAVEHTKQQQQALDAIQQQQRQLLSNVEYARENKERLALAQQKLEQERQQQLRRRIGQLEADLEQTKVARLAALEELQTDHNARVLELTAEFQEKSQLLQEAINDLNTELNRKQGAAKQRIEELEHAFSRELSDSGVDEQKLSEIKNSISQLQQQIRDIDSRRDEYSEYQTFIRLIWEKQRVEWLEHEQQVKMELRKASSDVEQHERQFKAQLQEQKSKLESLKDAFEKIDRVASDLQSLVKRMEDLPVALNPPKDSLATQGDVIEHCARSYQLLDEKQKQDKELEQRIPRLEKELREDADLQFLRFMEQSLAQQGEAPDLQVQVNTLSELLKVLEGKRDQTLDQGKTIGKGLFEFFTVFNDIHKRVSEYSRRLTHAVTDELRLDGIDKAEVKISSTIDELSFWEPLKRMTQYYRQWIESGTLTPPSEYIDRLTDVAELLKANQEYSIESLIKLQLNLVENGEPVVIRNDRQLTDSSSHGMAYLILCKFLLAFTRLLRSEKAGVIIHWPIDEIGTLAYHNVEKLFTACDNNNIDIVGAFPNPESDVLLLFKHRYLIEPHKELANKSQLKRIKPKVSELSQKLQSLQQQSKEASE